MTVAITRHEPGAGDPRREAARCRDARAARRMLALALVPEGAPRAEAARAAGMDRQTLRDRVHRYDEEGLAGLRDRPRSGRRPRLTPGQEAELAAAAERRPDPDRDGVVRWRRVDLRALIEARFAVRLHERSVGKVPRRLGGACPPAGRRPDRGARLSVRPRHPKADEAAQAASEKASPSWSRRRCPSTRAASRSRSGSRTRPAAASRAR
jgi:transposase